MTFIPARSIIDGTLTDAQKESISEKIARLGQAMMTTSAHGYTTKGETIMAAATRGARDYTKNSRASSAIAIMDVILAANRNYNKQVKKYVEQMRSQYSGLTIKQLAKMANEAENAADFRKVWGHNDEQKFKTLRAMLAVIVPWLKRSNNNEEDFRVMSSWAAAAKLSSMYRDPIGALPNVGIATFQHLRMTFGVNTVKPDRRVKDVLKREFGLRLSDDKSILVVERIAELEGVSPLQIDQIFVKYGSGHYRPNGHEDVRTAVASIVRNLKNMQLDDEKIAKATGWSLSEIQAA